MREYLICHMIALSCAILLDILIGDPHGMPHPVRAIGSFIGFLDGKLNPGDEKEKNSRSLIARGAVMWFAVTVFFVTITAVLLICAYIISLYLGLFVEIGLTFYILAAGSLRDESMKVYKALGYEEKYEKHPKNAGLCRDTEVRGKVGERIINARMSLSMIVGRDTGDLDEDGIIRATVETVAENTSDGVIAPLLYTAIGGPILGMLYKCVNTMDSMVGYHNERYEYFGKFSAVADDIVNFVPSRLSAMFMIAASALCNTVIVFPGKEESTSKSFRYDVAGAYRIWRRDRLQHKSPNSAQTESACAGALGVRLAGDAYYGGILVSKPFIGDNTRDIEAYDIRRSVRLMFFSEAVCTAVIFTIMILILIFP